ncbi:MAG TPA: helix-turn-helix transcriptional regulator [Gemmatimonadaceae bacterium]|nr:helix-turn-helix transcriptional regulator [Gemmatimonadaceae bacterium]
MNQARLAEELGVSQQAVSAWLSGRALPEPGRMAVIEGLLGIPMRDWVAEAEESGEHAAVADADDTGTG